MTVLTLNVTKRNPLGTSWDPLSDVPDPPRFYLSYALPIPEDTYAPEPCIRTEVTSSDSV